MDNNHVAKLSIKRSKEPFYSPISAKMVHRQCYVFFYQELSSLAAKESHPLIPDLTLRNMNIKFGTESLAFNKKAFGQGGPLNQVNILLPVEAPLTRSVYELLSNV